MWLKSEKPDDMRKNQYTLFIYILTVSFLFPLASQAQKITVGSCTMKDGGEYRGEMMSGRPHGKGITKWKDGDTFEDAVFEGGDDLFARET